MIAVSKNKRGQLLFLEGHGEIHDTYLSLEMELSAPLEMEIGSILTTVIDTPIQTDGDSLAVELDGSLVITKECS